MVEEKAVTDFLNCLNSYDVKVFITHKLSRLSL